MDQHHTTLHRYYERLLVSRNTLLEESSLYCNNVLARWFGSLGFRYAPCNMAGRQRGDRRSPPSFFRCSAKRCMKASNFGSCSCVRIARMRSLAC
jgi:hypothetical protein